MVKSMKGGEKGDKSSSSLSLSLKLVELHRGGKEASPEGEKIVGSWLKERPSHQNGLK